MRVAEAAKGLDPAAQVAFVERSVPDPDQKTTNTLWLIFVPALVALVAMFGWFMYQLIKDDKTGT